MSAVNPLRSMSFSITGSQPEDQELRELTDHETEYLNAFFLSNAIDKVVNPVARQNIQYKQLMSMNSYYREERIRYHGCVDRWLDDQIFCYNSKLYNREGCPITTKKLDFDAGAILVMDKFGNLFLAHKERGKIHHSSFFSGAPVAYACMLEIENGVILKEAPWSGHYLPKEQHREQFYNRLTADYFDTIKAPNTRLFSMIPVNAVNDKVVGSEWFKLAIYNISKYCVKESEIKKVTIMEHPRRKRGIIVEIKIDNPNSSQLSESSRKSVIKGLWQKSLHVGSFNIYTDEKSTIELMIWPLKSSTL